MMKKKFCLIMKCQVCDPKLVTSRHDVPDSDHFAPDENHEEEIFFFLSDEVTVSWCHDVAKPEVGLS